jgi:hypothetical protein
MGAAERSSPRLDAGSEAEGGPGSRSGGTGGPVLRG